MSKTYDLEMVKLERESAQFDLPAPHFEFRPESITVRLSRREWDELGKPVNLTIVVA